MLRLCVACIACLFVGVASAQITEPGKANPAALEAETLMLDAQIIRACETAAGAKPVCGCVFAMLKAEMTLREYEAAALLYSASLKGKPWALQTAARALSDKGYGEQEILAIDAKRSNMLQGSQMQSRCQANARKVLAAQEARTRQARPLGEAQ